MKRIIIAGFLLMNLVLCQSALASHDTDGVITGVVAVDGVGPMMNGIILFFDEGSGPAPQSPASWRAPTFSFRVDENGRFEAHLPAGRYTVGALERRSWDPTPPKAGENFFIKHDEEGKAELITVQKGTKADLGLVHGAP